MRNAQDVLMGGGLPSVKLHDLEDRFDGVILEIGEPFQARDYVTGNLKWWNEGKENQAPMLTVPVEVQSDLDGKSYGLYVTQGTDLQKVLSKAVREAGSRNWEIGAHISVAVIGFEEVKRDGKKLNDKKLHGAIYTPPPSRGQAALADPVSTSEADGTTTTVRRANVDLSRPPAATQPQQQATTPEPQTAVTEVAQPAGQPAAQTSTGLDISQFPPEVQEMMRQHMNAQQQ